jgi:hypothetical protein
MKPSPISAGCRNRRRNAWFGSGKRRPKLIVSALHFSENQKTRRALLARGFGVIARLDEARPGFAPIVGGLCGPLEIGRSQQML